MAAKKKKLKKFLVTLERHIESTYDAEVEVEAESQADAAEKAEQAIACLNKLLKLRGRDRMVFSTDKDIRFGYWSLTMLTEAYSRVPFTKGNKACAESWRILHKMAQRWQHDTNSFRLRLASALTPKHNKTLSDSDIRDALKAIEVEINRYYSETESVPVAKYDGSGNLLVTSASRGPTQEDGVIKRINSAISRLESALKVAQADPNAKGNLRVLDHKNGPGTIIRLENVVKIANEVINS